MRATLADDIACALEMRNAYIILINKSEGKKQVRNHRHRKGKLPVVACFKTLPAFAFTLRKESQ
jgi:hypothetical protein